MNITLELSLAALTCLDFTRGTQQRPKLGSLWLHREGVTFEAWRCSDRKALNGSHTVRELAPLAPLWPSARRCRCIISKKTSYLLFPGTVRDVGECGDILYAINGFQVVNSDLGGSGGYETVHPSGTTLGA